jgi:hypothetical protein
VSGLPTLERLLSLWKSFRGEHASFALLIENHASLSFTERCDFGEALATLAEARGVGIECDQGWAQATPWRLPFSIAALVGDAVVKALIERNRHAPPHWPFRYATATRQFDRHQVLLLSKPLDAALSALTQAPPKLKANLAIINGFGDVGVESAQALLEQIGTGLSLSGIAVVRKTLARDAWANAIHGFAFEISHDLPVDAAAQFAFGNDTLFYGNVSLLREARMSAQALSLANRMALMPKTMSINVSEGNANMLKGLKPPSAARPISVGTRAKAMMSAPPQEMSASLASAAPGFAFSGETQEASAVTELSAAVRSAAAATVTASTAARAVQQQCFVRATPQVPLTKINDAFVVNETVVLLVRIGNQEDGQWQSSTVAFPDHELPANESKHRLTVMFFEPNHLNEPMLADIELRHVGSSSEATFTFTPLKTTSFEARVSIIHRGRVLQTALLRAQVLGARSEVTDQHRIAFFDETQQRHDWTSLDQRARFDLAFICNHDSENTPGVTAISDRLAWAPNTNGIESVVTEINSALSDVAKNTKDYADGLDKGENPRLLADLALSGRELFVQLIGEQLLRNTAGNIDLRADNVTHIQIVGTRPDAVIPIEFIYDYPPVDDEDPVVCPNHRTALETGHCAPQCRDDLLSTKHVCPMGFWGLRKVIERHTTDHAASLPDTPRPVALSESTSAQSKLGIRESALVGHSDRVTAASVAPLVAILTAKMKHGVTSAADWNQWAQTVAAKSPQLLIAFPHNDGSGSKRKLELGGSVLQTTSINIRNEVPANLHAQALWHVRAPNGEPPMVFLLGCDTAGTAETFGSHVAKFRLAGAAIVVSTIATVFGEHAVRVGTSIIDELLKRTSEGDTSALTDRDRLGEILRDAKRAALLQSLPMALCVVAFGDSDWSL